MKDKLVGCGTCLTEHLLSQRVKPESYSGGEWVTVCPNCLSEGFISTRQLRIIKSELTS